MSDGAMQGSTEESFWPSPVPARTSILKFGTVRDVLVNAGRLAGQGVIAWLISILFGILIVSAIYQRDDASFLIANEIVKLASATISVFLAVRILEDSDLTSIGLRIGRSAFRDFLFGFLLTCLVLGCAIWLASASGWLQVRSSAFATQSFGAVSLYTLLNLVIFLFVGWSEELLSRGFHLRIISKGLNRPLGVLLSSAIFAYLHHDNPDATASYFAFVFVFGLLAAFAVIRTGQLWLAIGLHAGWDFFFSGIAGGIGPIFGTGVFHILDLYSTDPFIPFRSLEFPVLVFLAVLVYFYTAKRKPEIHDW